MDLIWGNMATSGGEMELILRPLGGVLLARYDPPPGAPETRDEGTRRLPRAFPIVTGNIALRGYFFRRHAPTTPIPQNILRPSHALAGNGLDIIAMVVLISLALPSLDSPTLVPRTPNR